MKKQILLAKHRALQKQFQPRAAHGQHHPAGPLTPPRQPRLRVVVDSARLGLDAQFAVLHRDRAKVSRGVHPHARHLLHARTVLQPVPAEQLRRVLHDRRQVQRTVRLTENVAPCTPKYAAYPSSLICAQVLEIQRLQQKAGITVLQRNKPAHRRKAIPHSAEKRHVSMFRLIAHHMKRTQYFECKS